MVLKVNPEIPRKECLRNLLCILETPTILVLTSYLIILRHSYDFSRKLDIILESEHETECSTQEPIIFLQGVARILFRRRNILGGRPRGGSGGGPPPPHSGEISKICKNFLKESAKNALF